VKWFYILTLQWSTNQGTANGTFTGVWTAGPGATRSNVFQGLVSACREKAGPAAARAGVTFFSLEPESLS
jgi:hypothetical protein